MKRIFTIAAVLLFCCTARLSADEVGYWRAGFANFQVGDFCYKFTWDNNNWNSTSNPPQLTGNVVLTGYTGSATDVSVPASVTYLGTTYPVVAIGSKATMEKIQSDEFALARTSIKNLTLPASVISLDETYRQEGSDSYPDGTFTRCYELETITVDPDNPKFSSSNDGILFNKDKTTLWAYPVNKSYVYYKVPNTVISIYRYAFHSCKKLITADLSNNTVEEIGHAAFAHSIVLSVFKMSTHIKYIRTEAFENCSDLPEINLYYNGTNGTNSEGYGLVTVGDYAFAGSGIKRLLSYGLPETLTYLGVGTFYNCHKLEGCELTEKNGIVIPDNITKIPNYLFHHACKVETIVIPEQTTEIGKLAFCACLKLKDFEPQLSSPYIQKIGRGAFSATTLKNALLGESVTEVGDYAFGCNKDLTEFTIPENCILGKGVLTNTPNLTKINNYNTNRYTFEKSDELTLGVLYGNSTSRPGTKNELVYFIPKNEIGASNKAMVKQWVVPTSVERICNGSMTFHRIESLILPSNLTTIEDYAFSRFIHWSWANGYPPSNQPYVDPISLSWEESNYWKWTLAELTIPAMVNTLDMNAFFSLSKGDGETYGGVYELQKTSYFSNLYFMTMAGSMFETTMGGFVYDQEYNDEDKILSKHSVRLIVQPDYNWPSLQKSGAGACEGVLDQTTIYTTKYYYNYEGNTYKFLIRMLNSPRRHQLVDYKIPFFNRNLNSEYKSPGQYLTMCRDFDLDFSGEGESNYPVYAYIATECTDKSEGYKMQKVMYVPARTGNRDQYHGVIVRLGNYQDDGTEPYYKMGENMYSSPFGYKEFKTDYDPNEYGRWKFSGDVNPSVNRLVGVVANSHVQAEEDGLTNWGLSNGEWRRIVNTGRLTPYNRAYLQPTAAETAIMTGHDGQNAKVGMFFIDGFDDETTAIDSPDSTSNEEETDAWYQLDGRRIEGKPTAKGIYIHNGRKEVIK